ncbi:hypothetical protein [Pedobacter immunditicola]|uniref:hypothetical protein n=1 Tax=Pedobacter immunditicola TaxID=3133440 RepID=UPI00309D1303
MKKFFVFLILSVSTVSCFAQLAAASHTPATNIDRKSAAKTQPDSLSAKYQSAFDDPKIKSYFNLSTSARLRSGVSSSKVIGPNTYHAFEIGSKAITLFSNLLHCNENQIELPKSLKDKYLSYCFKEDSLTREQGEKLLLKLIVENLKLKTTLTEALQDVVVVEIVDSVKLNLAKAIQKKETGITEINSEGTSAIRIENGSLYTLADELKRALTSQVVIKKKDLYTDHYDFYLHKDSFEVLQQSLLKYGLSLKIEQKNLQKYLFED